MSAPSKQQENDALLSDLWRRRFNLPETDMTRLCTLVCHVLSSYRPQELAGLPDEHKDYVNHFIVDKILQPSGVGDFLHAGGLRLMYRNYLRDQIDRLETWKKFHVTATVYKDDESAASSSGVYSYAHEPCGANFPGETEQALLREHHLTVDMVCAAARGWLSRSESWVPPYLAFNYCADTDVREPLVHLARRYAVHSYHAKAEKLGFNWDGEKARKSGRRFGETLIGKWLAEDLGIPIDDNHIRVIKIAFDLLCFEALNWGEQQEIAR
jgi:hypothetical protein